MKIKWKDTFNILCIYSKSNVIFYEYKQYGMFTISDTMPTAPSPLNNYKYVYKGAKSLVH